MVSLAVACIAWQQWQVAHAKLRLDLFDRRYKVYDATRAFLSVIVANANFDNSQLFTFYAGISDAGFLFDAAVVDYLEQIKTRAIDMRLKNKLLGNVSKDDERARLAQAETEQLLWLNEHVKVMGRVFTPYLGFSHIK
jgi:hypothetical protein